MRLVRDVARLDFDKAGRRRWEIDADAQSGEGRKNWQPICARAKEEQDKSRESVPSCQSSRGQGAGGNMG